VRLRDRHQRVREVRAANELGGRFGAAVVHNDDFETRPVRLPRKGLQAALEHGPVVVNGDNNTEKWCLIRSLLVLDHAGFFALL
jgi:hypothetical protein